MTRKDLFENIGDYSPKEIAAAIKEGIVTFYELQTNTHGQFSPLTQRHVKAILEKGDEPEAPSNTPVIEESPRVEEPIIATTPIVTPKPTPAHTTAPVTAPAPEPPQAPQTPSAISFDVTGGAVLKPEGPQTSQSLQNQPVPAPTPVQEPVTPSFQQATQVPEQPVPTPTPQKNGFEDNPSNIKSFNWGAFMFSWIWGVCNGVYWSLLALIPFAGWVVSIILGFRGNRDSWEALKQDITKEDFVRRQRGWNVAGIIVFALSLSIFILFTIILFMEDYTY